MFFSLTALGPASLGLPPARAATAWMQRLASPMHARPPCGAGLAGRVGGRQRCLALPGFVAASSARLPSAHPRPAPGWPHRPRPAAEPPCAHPGVPHLLGPGLRASGPAGAQGARPRPHCRRHSPHPAARAQRRAWHGAKLPGSPARAGELSCEGVCAGRGGGALVPGDREAQMPAGRPPTPGPLSPESHKGTDNTGGLVKTVMCRSRQTNKSPYLFI